ncbi:MAG: DegT/DnrJ/EryC1/StrS aminotransferase family protein [Candidatus Sumerlaeaceae bacterium]|nr:DegT/DnrJ/EryC1/StrS aminotransferase family protein [Candidatus Sumerlaeaceae bacterium]
MWRIPLSDLNYDEQEQQAVAEVLQSCWLTMGPRTEQFEAAMAAYLGVKHAIAVANCTCALELAYEAAIEARGGERRRIIVPDITFVATANAAIAAGGIPELLDVEGWDHPMLNRALTESVLDRLDGQTAVLAIVHYAGFDANSVEFRRLSNDHGIILIEDAAHATGGKTAAGRALGTTGDIGCFSFFSNKNLATGEGGLVVTNSDDFAARIRLARSHGMTTLTYDRHRDRRIGYDVVRAGHNYRCTEITAALGLVQLAKLDAANARRRELYRLYCDNLKGCDGVRVLYGQDSEAVGKSACHILPLLCRDKALRDKVREALTTAGIQSSHHYPALHSFTFYRDYLEKKIGASLPEDPEQGSGLPVRAVGSVAPGWPNAANFAARQITLPLYPALTNSAVSEICDIVILAAG